MKKVREGMMIYVALIIISCYAILLRLVMLALVHYIKQKELEPTKEDIRKGLLYAIKHFLRK